MSDETPRRVVPPGWYPDPVMPGTQRYWDGERWSDKIAPMQHQQHSSPVSPQLVTGLVVAASVGGDILSQQSVSIASGSGIVWVGAVLAIGAAIVAFVVKSIPSWAQVICVLVAIGATVSAVYVENELSDRREELSHLFDSN